MRTKQKRLLLLLCPWIAAMVIASAIAADPPATQQNDTSGQLESLLKERQETFRQLVDFLNSRYRSGFRVTEESILHASNQLLEAELDLTTKKEQRVALREKLVANLKKIEKITDAQVRRGVREVEDAYQAKAAQLKGEIQWLREKAGNE